LTVVCPWCHILYTNVVSNLEWSWVKHADFFLISPLWATKGCDEHSLRAKHSSNLSHWAYLLMALIKVRGRLSKKILPQKIVAQHASSVPFRIICVASRATRWMQYGVTSYLETQIHPRFSQTGISHVYYILRISPIVCRPNSGLIVLISQAYLVIQFNHGVE